MNASLAYGLGCAVTYNYEGKGGCFNARTLKYDLKHKLVVDILAGVAGRTIAAMFLWPGMLEQHLTRLEHGADGQGRARVQGYA